MSLTESLSRAMRLPLRTYATAPCRHFTTTRPHAAGPRTTPMQELFPTMSRSGELKPSGSSGPRAQRQPRDFPSQQILRSTRSAERQATVAAQAEAENNRKGLEATISRRWTAGDVYAPHDLSGTEMQKWAKVRPRGRPDRDLFDVLAIDPRKHYLNFNMMSEFVTNMGKIKSGLTTGLRARNQRRISKAVKRAQGMGLMPKWYKHPELLRPKFEKMR